MCNLCDGDLPSEHWIDELQQLHSGKVPIEHECNIIGDLFELPSRVILGSCSRNMPELLDGHLSIEFQFFNLLILSRWHVLCIERVKFMRKLQRWYISSKRSFHELLKLWGWHIRCE